jgi:hypothetical protein
MLAIVMAAGLQDQAGSYPLATGTGYSQKFRPPLEAPDAGRTRFRRHLTLSAQTLAALGPAGGQNPAATDGSHTGAKTVPVLAHDLTRLVRAFHDTLR